MKSLTEFFGDLNELQASLFQVALDEAVHEAKAEEASKINNEGPVSQAVYLGFSAYKLNNMLKELVAENDSTG